MTVAARACIEGYIGASGSGKGLSMKRRLDQLRPSRLLIYDPRNEYGERAQACADLRAIVRQVERAGPGGPFRVRFVPDGSVDLRTAFSVLCRLAFEAGRLVFLADELSDVTTPSWAPPAWRMVTSQGRHRELIVIGAAQRPAMIDKAFLGNCTLVRVGVLEEDPDRRAVARRLDVPLSWVTGLQATEQPGGGVLLTMLQRDRYNPPTVRVTVRVDGRGRVTERIEAAPAGPVNGEKRPR